MINDGCGITLYTGLDTSFLGLLVERASSNDRDSEVDLTNLLRDINAYDRRLRAVLRNRDAYDCRN